MRLPDNIRQYLGLPPPIYFLALASVVTALGAFVFPFLTLTLTARLHMTPKEAGLIVSLVGVSSMIGALCGGWVSDRYPRVLVLLAGQLISGGALCIAGFFYDSIWMLPSLLCCTFGFGLIGPSVAALIADLTPRQMRAEAYALRYMGVNLGFAIGPLIAGFLFHRYPAWIFWGDGCTTLLSALIVWIGLGHLRSTPPGEPLLNEPLNPEEGPPQVIGSRLDEADETNLEAPVEGSIWSVLYARPRLIIYMVGLTLFGMCYAQVTFTTPLSLDQLFSQAGADLFGWVMASNGLFVFLFTPYVTAHMKSIRSFRVLSYTGWLYFLGFGCLYFLPALSEGAQGAYPVLCWPVEGVPFSAFALLIVSSMLWTAGEVITVTQGSVFLANESPMSHRGRVHGIIPLIIRLTKTTTPLLMGVMIMYSGLAWVWVWVGALGISGAMVFLWADRPTPTLKTQHTPPLS